MLNASAVGSLTALTVEFGGLPPVGLRRAIDSFDYVAQGSLRRVNLVAPPAHDWFQLMQYWGSQLNVKASLSIRSGMAVVLSLNDVMPLHYAVVSFDAGAGMKPLSLLSFSGTPVLVRVRAVLASKWDRYMHVGVARGASSLRSR
jgi:hypothetical protein